MIKQLFQSLHESVKKRNTPDAYVVASSKEDASIHRGYINNSAYTLKYDFLPNEKGTSRNEGKHLYSFADGANKGTVEINHRINANQDSGHETTSTVLANHDLFTDDVSLRRTVIPAVLHHIKSHDPDIVTLKSGFQFTDDLLARLDPESTKYNKQKTKQGIVLKKIMPIDDKSKRIIAHIKKKLRLITNKE